MKKLFLGIVIGLVLSLGGVVAAQSVGLIQVPSFVGGYSTLDLLTYLSQLKAKDDANQNGCLPGYAFSVVTGHACHAAVSSTVLPSPSSGAVITNNAPISTMYTITPSTNPLAPVPPEGAITEQAFRDFCETVNTQQSWQVACQTKPIDVVITAMQGNGYVIQKS